MQDIFSTLGTVTEVRILKDRATGLSQGSAFVKFDNHDAAALAQQTISGRVLYNKVRLLRMPCSLAPSICHAACFINHSLQCSLSTVQTLWRLQPACQWRLLPC